MKSAQTFRPLSTRPSLFYLLLLSAFSATAYGADETVNEESIELESITVTGKRPSAWQSPNGVVATRSATATKTDTRLLHTPASVSVITRDQMRQLGAQNVAQALRYTPGTFSESRTSSRYDSIFLRGFGGFGGNANFVQYLDGQRLPAGQGYLKSAIDPYLLERIDVVRGANSVQYGQINPGGLVNQISKRAYFEPKREVVVQAGGNRNRFVGFDLNQPLGQEEGVALRLTGLHRYSESKTDLAAERYALAPSLTWRIGPQTELTAHAQWQHDPSGGDYNAVPAYGTLENNPAGNVPDQAFLGERSFERFKRDTALLGYRLSHTWNEQVSLQHNLLYAQGRSEFRNTSLLRYLRGTTWARAATASDETMRGIHTDAQLRFRFHTGALKHTLNIGADYQNSRADRLLGNVRGGAAVPPVDAANPQSSVILTPPWQSDGRRRQHQFGLYVQNQMEAGSWLAQLGVRHDRVRARETVDRLLPVLSQQQHDQRDSKTTYQAALMYRSAGGLSPYASYATSFEPVSAINLYGDKQPFRPTTAEQWEIGLKYQPDQFRALFGVSAFQLTRNHVLTKDTRTGAHPSAQIQTGQVRVRGVELEARAEWNGRLSTIAALTWLKPEVTRSNIAEELGRRPVGLPPTMASLWLQYALFNEKLKLSAGVRHVSASYADVANTVKTPAATLIDLGAHYDLGHLSQSLQGATASLNIHNAADKIHYGGCFSRGTTGSALTTQCFPGSRRSIVFGLNYNW
ncbi:MAG: TonB-dependent siderophore receptor [Eikenella sp.]|nr:TonB-dependent siderophore receptor [Eikenella sp.]